MPALFHLAFAMLATEPSLTFALSSGTFCVPKTSSHICWQYSAFEGVVLSLCCPSASSMINLRFADVHRASSSIVMPSHFRQERADKTHIKHESDGTSFLHQGDKREKLLEPVASAALEMKDLVKFRKHFMVYDTIDLDISSLRWIYTISIKPSVDHFRSIVCLLQIDLQYTSLQASKDFEG